MPITTQCKDHNKVFSVNIIICNGYIKHVMAVKKSIYIALYLMAIPKHSLWISKNIMKIIKHVIIITKYIMKMYEMIISKIFKK